MSQQPFDQGIPLLTEVLLGPEVPDPAVPAAPAVEEAQVLPPSIVQPDWDAIEQRLTQRILHQVQGKIDHLLEERIAHVLQTALQNALIGMRGALREDLQQSLEQIVAHAVSHELGHLHPPAH
ncbi:hypothetical protein [Janthinobacterium kumbetense]|uniref:DUF2486 domain-containing protein n=1 Tax=Janthinobacterium kumbetense TaxID=2950280 RepID=A0ABT0WTU2_9BURK|nr:hypothetical protein [Janthinobacterium kumbetense]MCM2567461.1 hypothetical protein [Janthinobacterium kumbetense]